MSVFIEAVLSMLSVILFHIYGNDLQVSLMLLSLCVSQVASLIVVKCKTQFTFIRTQVIFHKIRIFVDVNCLQGQLTESLSTVPVGLGRGGHTSCPGLSSSSVLEVHGDGLSVPPSLKIYRMLCKIMQHHIYVNMNVSTVKFQLFEGSCFPV